jgi:methylase of polypeptide subunit release factors
MEPLNESAKAIGQFFRAVGYTEENLSRFGLGEFSWSALGTLVASEWDLADDPRLNLLIRLFYLGARIQASYGEDLIPKQILQALIACGLLQSDRGELKPNCSLRNFGELLLAFDARTHIVGCGPDAVLGADPTTRLLANCSMVRSGNNVLDLCTGCGSLALTVAPIAAQVTGSDVNQRALQFGRLNLSLNEIRNVTFVHGDRFDPVTGCRFDAIVCNPPFLLAPTSGLLFTENQMELDGFVESLAQNAPNFLQAGGVFQMLCEWVELESEPWVARLKRWFEESHCDVHVWWGYEFSAAEYARKRAVEQGQLRPESIGASFTRRVSYFTRHGVKRILGGLITLRRRNGENWFWVEEMQKRPASPVGDALRERFSTRDLLETKSVENLLQSHPRLAGQVHLVAESLGINREWRIEKIYLQRRDELPATTILDGVVGQLVARCDGSATLEALLTDLASENKVALEMVVSEGLRVIKRLAESGMILLERL